MVSDRTYRYNKRNAQLLISENRKLNLALKQLQINYEKLWRSYNRVWKEFDTIQLFLQKYVPRQLLNHNKNDLKRIRENYFLCICPKEYTQCRCHSLWSVYNVIEDI